MNDEQKQEARILIGKSFLPEERKEELGRALDAGDAEAFWNLFDALLADDVRRRTEQYMAAIQGLDARMREKEEEYEEERKTIDGNLEQRLEGADPSDGAAKEKIWDAYYEEVRLLQEKYENEMKGVATDAAVAALNAK